MSLKTDLEDAIYKWVNEELIADLKDQLNTMDINASRELTQSFRIGKTSLSGNGEIVSEVLMQHYWKYINYGVNGTEVNHGARRHGKAPKGSVSFHESILEWIPTTGSTLPNGFKSYEQWAYAIMTNIRKHGKKPRPFVDKTIENLNVKQLGKDITKALADEIKRKLNGNND